MFCPATDPKTKVHCPACHWAGTIESSGAELNSIVRCPKCAEPCENVAGFFQANLGDTTCCVKDCISLATHSFKMPRSGAKVPYCAEHAPQGSEIVEDLPKPLYVE